MSFENDMSNIKRNNEAKKKLTEARHQGRKIKESLANMEAVDFRSLLNGVKKDIKENYGDTCGVCPADSVDLEGTCGVNTPDDLENLGDEAEAVEFVAAATTDMVKEPTIEMGAETEKSAARGAEVEQHLKDLKKEVGQNDAQKQADSKVPNGATAACAIDGKEAISEEPKEGMALEEPKGEISIADESKIEEKNWMKKAFGKNKGGLHRALHVAKGEKIPADKLNKATHSKDSHVRHMAQAAKNAQESKVNEKQIPPSLGKLSRGAQMVARSKELAKSGSIDSDIASTLKNEFSHEEGKKHTCVGDEDLDRDIGTAVRMAKESKITEEQDPWLPHIAGQCMVCKAPATIKDEKGGEYCSPECQKVPPPKSTMRPISYPTNFGMVGRPSALESKMDEAAPKVKRCPGCGREVEEDEATCKKCGAGQIKDSAKGAYPSEGSYYNITENKSEVSDFRKIFEGVRKLKESELNEEGMMPGGGSGTIPINVDAIPPTKTDEDDGTQAQNPETHDDNEKQPEADEKGEKEYFGKQGDDNYYYLLAVSDEGEGSTGGIASEPKPDVTPEVKPAPNRILTTGESKTPVRESRDPANDFPFIKSQLAEMLTNWSNIIDSHDQLGNIKSRIEAIVNAMNEAVRAEVRTEGRPSGYSSLQIIDASGKVVADAKEQDLDTNDPKAFLLKNMDDLELTEIAPDIVKKYLLADDQSTEDDEMTETPKEEKTNKVQGEPPNKSEEVEVGASVASESKVDVTKLMEKFNLTETVTVVAPTIDTLLEKFGLVGTSPLEVLLEKFQLNEVETPLKPRPAEKGVKEPLRDEDLTGQPVTPTELPTKEPTADTPEALGPEGTPNNPAPMPEPPTSTGIEPGVNAPTGGGVPGGAAQPIAPVAAQDMSTPESAKTFIQSEYPEEPYTSTALAFADSMIADPAVYGKVRQTQWGGIWGDADTLEKQAKIVGDYGEFSADTVKAITGKFGNSAKYKLARDVRPALYITVRDVGEGIEPVSLSELKGIANAREVLATENPGECLVKW